MRKGRTTRAGAERLLLPLDRCGLRTWTGDRASMRPFMPGSSGTMKSLSKASEIKFLFVRVEL